MAPISSRTRTISRRVPRVIFFSLVRPGISDRHRLPMLREPSHGSVRWPTDPPPGNTDDAVHGHGANIRSSPPHRDNRSHHDNRNHPQPECRHAPATSFARQFRDRCRPGRIPAQGCPAPTGKICHAARTAQAYGRSNPWKTAGLMAAAGVILGVLVFPDCYKIVTIFRGYKLFTSKNVITAMINII